MACMINREVTENGIRVTDRANNELYIESPDWEPGGPAYDIPRSVDTAIVGYTTELRFPASFPYIRRLDEDESHELGSDTGPIELSAGDYLMNVNLSIKTFMRFSGTASLWKTDDYETVIVSFPKPELVTLGFRSHLEQPKDTIVIPPTPDGLATAITHLSSAHETTTPDRSYHTMRRHPPLIEIGDELSVPERVKDETPDTGIELILPRKLDYLFVAAPLAYHLQAKISVDDECTPTLRAPRVDLERELPPLPDFQEKCADLLRRVFMMDCLVRNAGPWGTDLHEARLLGEFDIDAGETYRNDSQSRLNTYLSVPFDRISDQLPEWHLSMYVKPELDHVPCLPFLIDCLSLIYLPKTSELRVEELVQRSLDDFYRGGSPHRGRPNGVVRGFRSNSAPTIDIVKPELQQGRVHGWLADGVPIDVFKTIPEAYENRLDYLEREEGNINITVVLNDDEMDEEHTAAAEIYKKRSEDLPIDLSVKEYLSKNELARVFEEPNDFVHYIGHCESDGLKCRNGNLTMADLEESNTQTFFLNACGSYYEGIDLIKKGSVAGAVTFNKVLNKQAVKVGTTFARMLIHGFSIERAMRLSRRRIMMGKEYAVVGDGTHVLTQCDSIYPITNTLESLSDGEYRLITEMFSTRDNGTYYQPYVIGKGEKSYMFGSESEFHLTREELRSFLDRTEMPTIYNGDLYWAEELLEII